MIYKLHRRSPYLKDHEQNRTKQNKTKQLTIYLFFWSSSLQFTISNVEVVIIQKLIKSCSKTLMKQEFHQY
jgi:hypothetical protein